MPQPKLLNKAWASDGLFLPHCDTAPPYACHSLKSAA